MDSTNLNNKAGQDGQLSLLSEFSPVKFEQWKQAALASLKGKPFEKLLSSNYEGIAVNPIYMKNDSDGLKHTNNQYPGQYPYIRGVKEAGYKSGAWDIAQDSSATTPDHLNVILKNNIERGVSSATFSTTACSVDYPVINSVQDFEKVFAGINIEETAINIKSGSIHFPTLAALASYCRKHNIDTKKLSGGLDYDPVGWLSFKGSLPSAMNVILDRMAEAIKWASENAPKFKALASCALQYNNGGGNAVQELAFAVATGAFYLREFMERGLSVAQITSALRFIVPTGQNFFVEIAKFRALKALWAKVVKEFGGTDQDAKICIYSSTTDINKSSIDRHTNILRSTGETMAAIIGGVDGFSVARFDNHCAESTDFSQRVARNTQIVLKEECNLTDVIDPAGGSYYVEYLTAQIMEKAWGLFTEIEGLGGIYQAAKDGKIQQMIAEVANRRVKNMNIRKDVLVGVNKYPNTMEEKQCTCKCSSNDLVERKEEVLAYVQARGDFDKTAAAEKFNSAPTIDTLATLISDGLTVSEAAEILAQGTESADTIPTLRLAEKFEGLIAISEAYREKNGDYPKVFMATMGPVRQHKARADFAQDFIQVGGFRPIYDKGYASATEAAEAFAASGANIAVLCSTDDTYPEIVPEFCQLAREKMPDCKIVLAGYPKDMIESYKENGINEFIHVRANIYEVLSGLQQVVC